MYRSQHTIPKQSRPNYLPTPQEIKAATARIQDGWDQEEHQKRSGTRYTNKAQTPHYETHMQIHVMGSHAK